jgi:hypothetical protein
VQNTGFMRTTKINILLAILCLSFPILSHANAKLKWGTYFGGTSSEYQKASRNTVDKDGNVYMV